MSNQWGAPACHQPHLAQYRCTGPFGSKFTVSHLPSLWPFWILGDVKAVTSLFIFGRGAPGGGGEGFPVRRT